MNKKDYAWVENKFLALRRKLFFSNLWFILLNVFSFLAAASAVILNLFAFKFNDVPSSVPYFEALSILGGVAAFIAAFVALFSFRKTSNAAKHKLESIEEQTALYKNKEGEYAKAKDASKIYISKLTKIYNDAD